MAWKYPSSISTTDTVALDLGTSDSALIDEDVLISSESDYAIQGNGNNHVVEVSGAVNSGFAGIGMGTPDAPETTGNAIFVDSEGTVDCTGVGGAAVAFWGNGNLLVNDGEITSEFAGVYFNSDVMVANRIVNRGTISGEYGLLGDISLGETILRNSGRIEGTTASYGYQDDELVNTIDIIHNRGVMAGSVFLAGNDDKFFGATGKLMGSLLGGDGNDELYLGAGRNLIDGGDGSDTIMGGAAADTIFGGEGTDLVVFNNTNDSTLKNYDVIMDITTNDLDRMDFHLIDANTKKPDDQAFELGAPGKIGHIWLEEVHKNDTTFFWIYGETDGDKQIDLAVKWFTPSFHGDEIVL
jgi:Ca2+-binding RTX toxin-like protein